MKKFIAVLMAGAMAFSLAACGNQAAKESDAGSDKSESPALSGNVVITADAHDAKALTFGFEEAAAKLKELGYTKVQVLGKNGFTVCPL